MKCQLKLNKGPRLQNSLVLEANNGNICLYGDVGILTRIDVSTLVVVAQQTLT